MRFAEDGRYEFTRNISPRYRFSDKLLVVYSLNINTKHNDVGFVKNINDSIYLGHRLLHTVTNQLTASYIFTNRMSLKLNARHYWSQAEYNRYSLLLQDGNLSDDANYATNHNVNYNSFNIYLGYIWNFKPGSEMSVVYQNSVYSSGSDLISSYSDNIHRTLQTPQSNSLSLKVIYYLDYLDLKKQRTKHS